MTEELKNNINHMDNGVYIVQNGQVVEVLLPKEYGQDIINWQHGRVFEVSESQRRRINSFQNK